jgi:hypothetical protein
MSPAEVTTPAEKKKDTLKDTKALRVIVAAHKAPLDPVSKAILIAYATCLSKKREDWQAWPGREYLAESTGYGEPTVTRSRQYLVERKLLIPTRRHPMQKIPHDGGRPTPNFIVDVEAIEALATEEALLSHEMRRNRGRKRQTAHVDNRNRWTLRKAWDAAHRDDLAHDIRLIWAQRSVFLKRGEREEAFKLTQAAERLYCQRRDANEIPDKVVVKTRRRRRRQ